MKQIILKLKHDWPTAKQKTPLTEFSNADKLLKKY